MKSHFLALLTLCLVFFPLSGFSEENPPVKISALLHLTGEYAQAGKAFREGMELAAQKVNTEGGVKGRKLEILFEDTRYDMKTVNTLSQKALSIDKVPFAVISNYTEVMVAGPVFERANVPLLTLWDSSPEIENLGKFVFGIGVWAPSTSEVAVEYSLKHAKNKTAVTVATNGQWSLAVAKSFAEQFRESDGDIKGEFVVNPDDVDFRSLLARVVRLKPDVIYAPLSDHQVPFWKQLEVAGYKGIRITSDILNEALIKEIGPTANGILQTQVSDPDLKRTREMLAEYQKAHRRECDQVFLTALGYDSVLLFQDAARRSKSISAAQISENLYKIKDFPGAAGLTTINEKGSARKAAKMFRVVDGVLEKD